MIHVDVWENSGKDSIDILDMEVDEILLQKQIVQLIGGNLQSYFELENEEINEFRFDSYFLILFSIYIFCRCLATRSRLETLKEVEEEDLESYILHEYKETIPKPLEIPLQNTCQIFLPSQGEAMKTIFFSENDDVCKLRDTIVEKFEKFINSDNQLKPDEFILKVTGFQSYLLGGKMIDYDYIRDCICKKKNIVLSLVNKEEILRSYPHQKIATFGFVDKMLANIPIGKNFDESDCIFISDDNERLNRLWKIKINSLQNIPETHFPSNVLNKGENWYIFAECNFMHGNQNIHSSVTQAMLANVNVRFSHTLFTLPLKEIPRGLIINFVIKKFVGDESYSSLKVTSFPSETVGYVKQFFCQLYIYFFTFKKR